MLPAGGLGRRRVVGERPVREKGPIRVLVVSSVRLFCEGLRTCLSDDPEVEVVGAAGGHEQALRAFADARPDVVLVDLQMPRAMDFTRAVCGGVPRVPVVALAADEEDFDVTACAAAGVAGVLSRDAT